MKAYFSRAEVARILGIKPETLKLWEKTLGFHPRRVGNRRIYARRDLRRALLIKTLMEQEQLTLEEVKAFLRDERAAKQREMEALRAWKQHLDQELTTMLREIRDLLRLVEGLLDTEDSP